MFRPYILNFNISPINCDFRYCTKMSARALTARLLRRVLTRGSELQQVVERACAGRAESSTQLHVETFVDHFLV